MRHIQAPIDVRPKISWVLFDVGGVLVKSRPAAELISPLLGLDSTDVTVMDMLTKALWVHRDAYDAGLSDREYWDAVAHECGISPVEDALLERLVEADTGRMEDTDDTMMGYIQKLRSHGVRCAILSNAPMAIANAVRATGWYQDAFELSVFSAEVGMVKPNPDIYEYALICLGNEPNEVVFVDDRAENVQGAQLCGLLGVCWDGSHAARGNVQSATGIAF